MENPEWAEVNTFDTIKGRLVNQDIIEDPQSDRQNFWAYLDHPEVGFPYI